MPRKIPRKSSNSKAMPAPLGKVATDAKRGKATTPPRSNSKRNPDPPEIIRSDIQEMSQHARAKAVSSDQDDETFRASLSTATHEDLISRATALAPEGEGVLVLIVSTPRGGKSDLAKKFAKSRTSDIVLIHDPKIPPNYPWACEIPNLDPATIASAPGPLIRFDERTTPDQLAQAGMSLARGDGMEGGGIPTTTIIDENMRALSGPQGFIGDNLKKAYTEGSSQGHSLIALTQIPQWSPTVQIDFSQAVILGRNGGRTLSYLQKILILTDECARTIQGLRVGEWVLTSRYEKWDRTVYYSPQQD